MKNIKKISILVFSFFIGFYQFAHSWTPNKEIEIISHAKETSSTYAFARAVAKAIEDEKLLPNGVSVKIVGGARGGKARNYVLNTNADPHVMQVLTPSQINNAILAYMTRFAISKTRLIIRALYFFLTSVKNPNTNKSFLKGKPNDYYNY